MSKDTISIQFNQNLELAFSSNSRDIISAPEFWECKQNQRSPGSVLDTISARILAEEALAAATMIAE